MELFELVITLYIGAMTYLANIADVNRLASQPVSNTPSFPNTTYENVVRRMLFGLVAMVVLFGIYANWILLLDLPSATLDEFGISQAALSPISLVVITALVIFVSGSCYLLITSQPVRERVRRLTGKESLYDAHSQVHLVAMVLALCLIGYLLINFVVAGGLQGVAKSIEENGISLPTLIFQGVMFVVISLLGVGLAIRRSPKETLERLGMHLPTPQNVIVGIVTGFILIGVALILTRVWTSLVTPEQYAEQSAAAAEISNQINTIQAVFILAATSAISEEILFRGALQPVFGLPMTTLLFVLFHDQYTLTPAMLIILSVGFGLAIVRRYQSNTSAIIAHFIYNFVPIAIIITWPQVAQTLGLS